MIARPDRKVREIAGSAMALCLLLSLFGCKREATAEKISWTEEARLSDGSTVVVARSVTLSSAVSREIGQGPREVEYTLAILLPSGSTSLTWTNPGKLVPLVLGFDQNITYLATMPHLMNDYDAYGCPTPGYVFFKYYRNEWQRIEYSEFPKQLQQANLLFYLKSNLDVIRAGTISANQLSKLNQSGGAKPPTINPNLGSPDNCGKSQIIDETKGVSIN